MPPRQNSVVVPDDDAGTSDAEALANSQKLGPSAKGAPIGMPQTVRIILEEGDNMAPTGQTFSINGRAYLIRPGEEVDVPIGIIEILDNAVMSVAVQDPQTMKVVGYRNRLRFPYRRIAGHVQ